jgi:hypothetical protein
VQSGEDVIQVRLRRMIVIVITGVVTLNNCRPGPEEREEPPIDPVSQDARPQICSNSQEPGGGEVSGIEGHVISVTRISTGEYTLGSPQQARIAITDEDSDAVIYLVTDRDGYFCVLLPPGTYRLQPQSLTLFAFVQEQTVTVHEGQMTEVEILYEIPLT